MTEKPASSNKTGIVYEVNALLAPELREAYLAWLQPHIEQMLSFKGFRRADILTASEAEPSESDKNSFLCTVNYLIDSAEDLDHYLKNHAATMRADGIARFGDSLQTSRRIFHNVATIDKALQPASENALAVHEHDISDTPARGSCLNCGANMSGQYCHVCGQRQQRKLISVTELVGDLVRDFSEWDSRFWRTLWPLLTKPGKLTLAYLEGRRMYYSPPLRMYLITSLLFFLIVNVQSQFSLMKMDISKSMNETITLDTSDNEVSGDRLDETPQPENTPVEDEQPQDLNYALKRASENCTGFKNEADTQLEKIIIERARQACIKITTPDGLRNFLLDLMDNAPSTFIFLLPLMALAHKILYLFSRRFYVEHLLFFVHNYSFIFLFTSILIVLSKISGLVGFAYFGWITLLSIIYMAYYFLKAMRVVYQQSRTITVLKWLISMLVFFGLVVFIFALFTLITAAMFT